MDAIEETAWQAAEFENQKLLYLYCVDFSYVFDLTIPSLPFLKLNCVFGHVSFPASLSERRLVVFPRSNKQFCKLKDVASPCVIEVVSSVNFQIHPDEVEDDDEVIVIWDFQIQEMNFSITSASSLVRPKVPSLPDKMPSMPLLNLTASDCNCTNFHRGQKHVLLKNEETQSATRGLQNLTLSENRQNKPPQEEEDPFTEEVEEEWDEDETDFDVHVPTSNSVEYVPDNNDSPVKEVLFTETYNLKGSSFHEHFQSALKLCKEALKKKETVPVKLIFEPVNRRDENAIIVQARFDTWQPIGYVPGIKVPKVTEAIRNKEITKIVIVGVKYQYIFPIKSFKYIATLSISKKGKWRKNKDSYKYNEDI